MPGNDDLFKVEILKTLDVAKALKTTPMKVTAAILNGTMPIGIAVEGEKDRTIIVKRRFEAWVNAKDLGANPPPEPKNA